MQTEDESIVLNHDNNNRGIKRKLSEITLDLCNQSESGSCMNPIIKDEEEYFEVDNAKRQKLLSDLPFHLDPVLVEHLHPSNHPSNKQNKQSNNNLLPTSSRPAKRLYIGNLPAGVTEAFLNKSLQALPNIKSRNPVKSIQRSSEKSYAFLEFENAEDASAALMLDGMRLHSCTLKVRRPTDYQPLIDPLTEPSNTLRIKANVIDGPNKIFIGGLPAFMTEDKIISFISAFGQLKSFKLVKDNSTGNSKGYAFFDYLDPAVTDRACLGLNGMKMGDKTLIVKRAISDKHKTLISKDKDSKDKDSKDKDSKDSKDKENTSSETKPTTKDNTLPLGETNSTVETRVVALKNMVKVEDLMDVNEYEDIIMDVREEAQKYGDVATVMIPRPPEDGAGNVFIEYQLVTDAVTATRCFSGRKFNGTAVLPSYYSEELFNKKDLSLA